MAASCDRLLMAVPPLLVSQKGYWIAPMVTGCFFLTKLFKVDLIQVMFPASGKLPGKNVPA